MFLKTALLGLSIAALLAAASPDARLADAAMRGDKAAVRSLLKDKADVNAAQGDGATALHWAAFRDDLEMANLLLDAGADVKAATREGAITPLFMACTNGSAAMVERLLKAGVDANSTKSNGTTALMIAAASGGAGAVKALLDHGANINARESAHGQTALMFAASLNRAEVVKLLMQHGADAGVSTNVNKLERVIFDVDGNVVPNPPARGGRGAAAPAAADPKAEEVAGNDNGLPGSGRTGRAGDPAANGGRGQYAPRQVGPSYMGGMTALLYAARDGQMDAARELIAAHADINEVSAGDKISPMVMAIINGHFDLAKMLLDDGANPNLVSEAGLTALYTVIDVQWAPHAWFPQPITEQEHTNYLDLMMALLAHGADINARLGKKIWFRSFTHDVTWVDPAGATAFWRAAQSTDLTAMKMLVEHGADPKIPNTAGDTPLMVAAGIGWGANFTTNAPGSPMPAVHYCLELGIDVNAVDNRGYTALHGAAYIGNNEMASLLVQKGAKVDVRTKAGDTVADMANGPNRFGIPHPETVALLEKLGSPNSHNCRSDQCLVAPREDNAPRRGGAQPAPAPAPPATPATATKPGTKEPGK
ncbi:MAG TPA: ankyrin repeat domain-containing protein [Bryobacteraceae bacterium]|nr:ankyrin repeat domain-containing protein [Bryobacteraceae bacterium]